MDEAESVLRSLLIDGELQQLRAKRDDLKRKLEAAAPKYPSQIHPLAVAVVGD